MILQRIRIIVVDVGFEPGTSATEVWRDTNELSLINGPKTVYYILYSMLPNNTCGEAKNSAVPARIQSSLKKQVQFSKQCGTVRGIRIPNPKDTINCSLKKDKV